MQIACFITYACDVQAAHWVMELSNAVFVSKIRSNQTESNRSNSLFDIKVSNVAILNFSQIFPNMSSQALLYNCFVLLFHSLFSTFCPCSPIGWQRTVGRVSLVGARADALVTLYENDHRPQPSSSGTPVSHRSAVQIIV